VVQRESSTTRKVLCKKCIHCKRQIRLTSKFCSFCGKPVPVEQEKKPQEQKKQKENRVSIVDKVPPKKIESKTEKQIDINKKPVSKQTEQNKNHRILPEGLINCPYCQEKISIMEKVCHLCHRSLKKCPLCNIINRGIAKFCRTCQSPFTGDKNDWYTFRGNNCRNGSVDEIIEFPFYFQWMYPKLGDSIGSLWASPVVSKDKIFVASKEKNLYALNQFTGELLWTQPVKEAIICTPAVEEKKIYIGCEDGKIFAIDNDKGGVCWYYDAEVEIGGSILSHDGKVYVPLKQGRIIVLNSAKNGSMVWCFPHRKSEPIREIVSSPSLCNNILIFASTNKTVYALQATDAKLLWKHQMKSPVIASCAINKGSVYLIDRGGNMAALDLKTGHDRWAGVVELPGPFTASPAVKDDMVVIASQRGTVYALNPNTGGIKWETSFNSNTIFEAINSSPVLTRDKVIVGTDGGSLYILEQSDGRSIWQFRSDSWIWASPAVSHGYVYITSNDGHIYSFSSKKPENNRSLIKS